MIFAFTLKILMNDPRRKIKIRQTEQEEQRPMHRLVLAGCIYLLGMAVVLVIKPSLMFTEDDQWKEFGIGRNPSTHTWMPLWLFSVFWALISYILVTLILVLRTSGGRKALPRSFQEMDSIESIANEKGYSKVSVDEIFDAVPEDFEAPRASRGRARRAGRAMELPEGYYVLNRAATDAAGGVPKYVFLGRGLN
jgi:hypothetical protein